MAVFSETEGFTKPKSTMQIDGMDEALTNSLWNLLSLIFPAGHNNYEGESLYRFLTIRFFNWIYDDIKHNSDNSNKRKIREWFFYQSWDERFRFIQFIAQNSKALKVTLNQDHINFVLKNNCSAYRLSEGRFIAITDEIELTELSKAQQLDDRFAGARSHISKAIDKFSQRPKADYPNTIKEAISAVESAAKVISGNEKGTLIDALKQLEKQNPMHPQFKTALQNLYNYTSSEGAIRHALLEGTANVSEADAHFMLVTCSAFINYLVARAIEVK